VQYNKFLKKYFNYQRRLSDLTNIKTASDKISDTAEREEFFKFYLTFKTARGSWERIGRAGD
jgi:hypothetical protein